ncbi:DUF3721 domain-containing protein [Cyanobium sp. NIES-981]|uniref:DUF3721 domain-containing protein n=1 Tax=Cyanobium sp. NIES-981 TaxID=1851505 RepID=UPI0007DD35A6|nr:DUF3721 domain-containing protein [Cyanobium sp. NIES-981]SBO44434.1 conserved exported protein of unknown function [Cyanobium sp. NIES-981]
MAPSSAILLLSAATLAGLVAAPPAVQAHSKGLYRTQAEAEQQARKLGCSGTHRNNGLWMPCSSERHLHQELRQQ